MYKKYASSQNYYFSNDINDILQNQRTEKVIKYKDFIDLDDEEETYLKRFYNYFEYENKLTMLSEYYKYHINVPRLFSIKNIHIQHEFYD